MDNRITAFEWITVDSCEGTLTSGTALVKASPLSEEGLAIYAKYPTHRTNSEAISSFAKVLNSYVCEEYMLRLLVSSFYYKSYYEFLQPALKGTTQRGLQIMRE